MLALDLSNGWVRRWQQENKAKVNAAVARRNAAKRNATPAWADLNAIAEIYRDASARAGAWQVDHIVPLQSKFVCGLHCEANLQILRDSENAAKRNRWWTDMFEPQSERDA